MKPAVDLRRVEFSRSGVVAAEHTSGKLTIVTEGWWLSLQSADEDAVENFRGAMRGIPRWAPDCLMDVVTAPGGPVIERLLRGLEGPDRADQVQYLVSFGEAWAYGVAVARGDAGAFDVKPVDELLLSMRLADVPAAQVEVLPAWLAYQQNRRPGMPIAKFSFSSELAPVVMGDDSVDSPETRWTEFTESEYEQGGRQLGPGLFEFYHRGDSLSVRCDLWLEPPPAIDGREAIFAATLRLDDGRIKLRSFDETYEAPVPAGEYDVSIWLVNRGEVAEQLLIEGELFARDDLERYEAFLGRRPLG